MGSPVSVVVANLVMEDVETRAIETFAHPSRLWLRYVDDTFVIIEKSFLNIFFDHINNLEPTIKFTMETENDNQLPFLNNLIQRSKNTELSCSIFRKPTHTDRYLILDPTTLCNINELCLTHSCIEQSLYQAINLKSGKK